MAENQFERPCIHVTLLAGVDPAQYHWVEIGAEEEGVPCRIIPGSGGAVLAEAYAAAQSSRFQVGIAVSDRVIVLHEMHMPPEQAVLSFTLDGSGAHACRVMGANAARMVVHKPLHVDLALPALPVLAESNPAPAERTALPVPKDGTFENLQDKSETEPALDVEFLTRLVVTVTRKILERGIS